MRIENKKIFNAYLFGAKNVMDQKNHLNKINVFPVADGDTGSNLFSTMNAIIREAKLSENVKKTFESIADAALGGARGNSGIIFAEYLNGVSIELEDAAIITLEHFAKANHRAVKYAYDAISEPVEGTMITVIKEWANALSEFSHKAEDIIELLTFASEPLEASVKNTQYQLASLKKAEVVDSGAKGFACFIEGVLEFFKSGKEDASDVINKMRETVEEIEEPLHIHTELTYRYCTEAMFEGKKEVLESIKKELVDLGDSLIVAGNDRILRMHIHTDDPSNVFEVLNNRVKVTYQKVDDMKLQSEVIEHRKSKIALVCDSIADLPQSFVDEQQIHMIHLNILFGEMSYLDKLTIRPKKLLEYATDKDLPTSSQPDIKQIENKLQYLLSHYDQILVLTVAGALSGTYSNFSKVATRMSTKEKPICVIDTKQNSGAEGLIVMECAKLIAQGLEFESIVKQVETMVLNSKIFVCIKTLENMIRSGRLSIKAGKIAKAIGMKPIITLDKDGNGGLDTVAFSFESSQKKLLKRIRKLIKQKKIKSYSLVHIVNEEEAIAFSAKLEAIIGFKPEYIVETSSVIAIGAGQGAIGFSYILEP